MNSLKSPVLERVEPATSGGKTIKRVLLMSLPAVLNTGDDYLADGHSFHLGLAYMAAILREHGLIVQILDCFAEDQDHQRGPAQDGWIELGLSNERILQRIRSFAPDLLGLSIPFSCQHYVATALAQLIKTMFPGLTVVAGGNHVSAVPDKLNPAFFDHLILGEGEHTFLQLIERLNKGEAVDGLPGLKSRNGSACPQAHHIENLDDLPFPALDLLPLDKIWASDRRWINMVATRGCVYDCTFCSIHTVMGRKIRRRSVDNVLAEIRHWKQAYNIQEIYFEDDNLTANAKWAKELFRRIAAGKFGIRFYARNGIRADTVDRELLTLMKAAGFQDFMIAPESGSQRTLDEIIGKKMKLEDCTRAVELAREVGIGVNAFFVLGFPEETWDDLEQTMRYARSLKEKGCAGFWLSLASPYPGTRLFKQCAERGLLPEKFDYRKCRTVDYQIENEHYTAAELKAFRDRAMQELAPPRLSKTGKLVKGLSLLTRDPEFFFVKLRYKLGGMF